jgi:hypothetical protein
VQAGLFRGYHCDPVARIWVYPIVVAFGHCVDASMVMDCDHWHSLCYLLSMELEVIMSEVKFYSCDIVGDSYLIHRRMHRCICPVCKQPTELVERDSRVRDEKSSRGIDVSTTCIHYLGSSLFDPVVVVCFRMGEDKKDVWGA